MPKRELVVLKAKWIAVATYLALSLTKPTYLTRLIDTLTSIFLSLPMKTGKELCISLKKSEKLLKYFFLVSKERTLQN